MVLAYSCEDKCSLDQLTGSKTEAAVVVAAVDDVVFDVVAVTVAASDAAFADLTIGVCLTIFIPTVSAQ